MQPKRKTKMRIVEVFFIYLIFLVKLNECIYIYIGKKRKKKKEKKERHWGASGQPNVKCGIFGHVPINEEGPNRTSSHQTSSFFLL
jgi:hypothetical protein